MAMQNLNWKQIGKYLSITMVGLMGIGLLGAVAIFVGRFISTAISSSGDPHLGKLLLYGGFSFSLLLVGWFASLSGVLLGGYLVYRTKRDPYDSFIRTGMERGTSFNLDDSDVEEDMTERVARGLGFPGMDSNASDLAGPTMAANNAFLNEMSNTLAEESAALAVANKE